jgi:hypothetical protein
VQRIVELGLAKAQTIAKTLRTVCTHRRESFAKRPG